MSNTRRIIRLSTAVAAILMTGLVSACSDATGPVSGRRAGYITTSAALNSAGVDTSVVAPTPTVKKPVRGGTPTEDSPQSGYNVTAF
jgi:hypothetical protein